MRSGKKTSENMLFYNLDTPDLIGNKYTHNGTEESGGACNGEAVAAMHADGGLS